MSAEVFVIWTKTFEVMCHGILRPYIKQHSWVKTVKQLVIWRDLMPLFLSTIFLDFSQMLHTSEEWTMHLFSGWVGGRRSQRWDLKADDERGGRVLVTVNLEDHETRSGNRGCQVGVGRHRTRKQHVTFYRWFFCVTWVSAADSFFQYLLKVLLVLNIWNL